MRAVVVLSAVALAAGLAGPARADESFLQAHPVRLWVGGAYPMTGLSASTFARTGLDAGASLQLFTPDKDSAVTASAEWLRADVSGTTSSLVPLLLNLRLHTGWQGKSGYRIYGGPGVGARYSERPVPAMRIDRQWMFTWQLAVGAEWQRGWLVEGRYLAGERPSKDGMAQLAVGYRL